MSTATYSTKQLADMAGVHPNTVRLYEEWGYLSEAVRKQNNYRVFTEKHLYEMQLARAALPGPYPIDGRLVHGLVKKFAAGEIDIAGQMAAEYLKRVDNEWKRALAALEVLDKWYADRPGDRHTVVCTTRKQAAARLGLTIDTLRTWERNELLFVNKDEKGRVYFSEWDMEKIMIVRLLRNCGYTIAALNRVLAAGADLSAKPSEILKSPELDSDINYVTDQYLDFLSNHSKRAQGIIQMISDYSALPAKTAGGLQP